MVDAERLASLVAELRKTVPSGVLEADEVIKQRDSIINQAYLESRRVRESAKQESASITAAARDTHETMVGETEVVKAAEIKAEKINDDAHRKAAEIVRQAGQEAMRILGEAEANAKERREGADQYTREVLFSLEERLSQMLGQVRRGIDALGSDVEPMATVVAGSSTNGRAAE